MYGASVTYVSAVVAGALAAVHVVGAAAIAGLVAMVVDVFV